MARRPPLLRYEVAGSLSYHSGIQSSKAARIHFLVSVCPVPAAVCLTADLDIIVGPSNVEPPASESGHMPVTLGVFTKEIDRRDMVIELEAALEDVCPFVSLPPEGYQSEVAEPGGLLSRVVEYRGLSGSIKAIGARLGIPRGTLFWRLRQDPDIDLELLFSRTLWGAKSSVDFRASVTHSAHMEHESEDGCGISEAS